MKKWMGNEYGNKKNFYTACAPRHVQSELCHKFLSYEFYSNEEDFFYSFFVPADDAVFHIQMSEDETNN